MSASGNYSREDSERLTKRNRYSRLYDELILTSGNSGPSLIFGNQYVLFRFLSKDQESIFCAVIKSNLPYCAPRYHCCDYERLPGLGSSSTKYQVPLKGVDERVDGALSSH